jgi:hypothetical protein
LAGGGTKTMKDIFLQTHTPDQLAYDRNGWIPQTLLLTKRTVRDEPGDMQHRGVWTFEGDFCFCPYSQISCAYGVADVHCREHLLKVIELTKKYGKTFIFTIVKEDLREDVESMPEHFEVLRMQQSWMHHGKNILLIGSKA